MKFQTTNLRGSCDPINQKPKKISPPPDITETRLSETVRHSMIDLLLLCFLAGLY